MASFWPYQPLPKAFTLHILLHEWGGGTFWSGGFSSLCLLLRCSKASGTEQESSGWTKLCIFLWYLAPGGLLQCTLSASSCSRQTLRKPLRRAQWKDVICPRNCPSSLSQCQQQWETRLPPLPHGLSFFVLFSLLSIVRIVGTLFKWKSLSSWALFANMDRCLEISHPVCKLACQLRILANLCGTEIWVPGRMSSRCCAYGFRKPWKIKCFFLRHLPRTSSAARSLVCHVRICTRLTLYHICIGFQCLATTPCLVLIGLGISEPLNIYRFLECMLCYFLFARVPYVTSGYLRGWCQGRYSLSAATFSPTHGVSPTGYRGMSSPETRVSTSPRGLAYACSWTPGAQHRASALLQVFLQTWLQARKERDPLGNGATFT